METRKEEPRIELRSGEMQELMGRVPPAILRMGISVILVFLVLAFASGYYIKYPDTITVMATLRNTNYAIDIKNSRGGIVRNEIPGYVRHVIEGETLAVITPQYGEEAYPEFIVSPTRGIAYPCDNFKKKDYVDEGTSFCTVADTVYLKVKARASVTNVQKGRLHPGMKAETSVNGCRMEGEITYIAKYANIRNGTYSMLMEFTLPTESAADIIWNYHATVKITTGEHSVLNSFFTNKQKNNP